MDVTRIKCPNCGAVLQIKLTPGIETKNVTCPVCKQQSKFSAYRNVATGGSRGSDEPHTEYGGKSDRETVKPPVNTAYGVLHVPQLGMTFRLKNGRNVVGRKAVASMAEVQIPILSKRMSREHLLIEVKNVQGKGIVHYLSLFKEQVNATFIGNQPLEYGDRIILKNNDIIKMPDLDVVFVLQGGDGTEY